MVFEEKTAQVSEWSKILYISKAATVNIHRVPLNPGFIKYKPLTKVLQFDFDPKYLFSRFLVILDLNIIWKLIYPPLHSYPICNDF